MPRFQHNLPQITPAQIIIPREYVNIEQRCKTLALDIPDVIGEAQYGKQLMEDAVKEMAQTIARIEDTDQASLMGELGYLGGLTGSGAPPLDQKSSKDSGPTDKNDAYSPPLLSQSRLKKLSGSADRAIDPFPTTGKMTHAVSFGMALTPALLDTKKFPSGYLALLSNFVIQDDFYADFLRVLFLPNIDPALCRARLIGHAQEATFQQLSVPRVNLGEDKKQVIQDTRYYGCIFYGHKVEIWEMSYDIVSGPNTTVQCLGTLNTADAKDLKLFTEFFYVLIRWGQVKRWASHIRNLHSYCWSLGGNERPMKMDPITMKQHWSSGMLI